jgi:hypothetical protein
MDGNLPNISNICQIRMPISPIGGQAESAVDSHQKWLFISNNATFGLVLAKLAQGGQSYGIKKYVAFGPPPGRPGYPRRQHHAHDRGHCGFGSPH